MRQITHEEFSKYPTFSHRLDWAPTEERSWYEHNGRLGIVLFDKADHDWSFVVMEKNDIGVFRMTDCGTSFPTEKEATNTLEKALQ